MEVATQEREAVRMVETERMVEDLAMIVPVYVPGGGDMTRVVTVKESWIDPRPVPAVLKGIARYFGVDVTAVRERYGDILGKRLNVPLPLSPFLVLVPLKMRVPRVAKDGTTGYVAMRWIERVQAGATPTSSILECGAGLEKLEILQSMEFARQQVRNARIVQTFYNERMQGGHRL